MRMLTSNSRRFNRTNHYRVGRAAPEGPRARNRVRVVRPVGRTEVLRATEGERVVDDVSRGWWPSAA